MKKFIEKLQQKSEFEKRVFAFWTAGFITLLILGIWFLNFISVFNNPSNNNVANPASALFDNVQDAVSNNPEVYQAE